MVPLSTSIGDRPSRPLPTGSIVFCRAWWGGTEDTPAWALETDNLEKNVPEGDNGLDYIVCERLRIDIKDGVPEVALDIGIPT